jgi:hypothetical protein
VYAGQHIGGCGFATQETDFVVALSNQTWESSRESKQPNSPSKFCGAEVLVTNQQTGMSIKAWVTEHCAYCVGACVSVFRFLSSRMRNMGKN